MSQNLFELKLILAVVYLSIILTSIYFLFSFIDIKDLMSYEFIKINKDIILKYKNENFFLLTVLFFIFTIVWILLLGIVMPLLVFSGFVFGKWWGITIIIISSTIGATLLYLLARLFFQDFVKEKFAAKFSNLKKFFNKNELVYFMFFRFIGGGGAPYPVQNVLPIVFNMSIKNYIIATFLGSLPSMFVTVAIGSGLEKIIDQNEQISPARVLFSPEIYIPIICFFILLIIGFIIKKKYFKE